MRPATGRKVPFPENPNVDHLSMKSLSNIVRRSQPGHLLQETHDLHHTPSRWWFCAPSPASSRPSFAATGWMRRRWMGWSRGSSTRWCLSGRRGWKVGGEDPEAGVLPDRASRGQDVSPLGKSSAVKECTSASQFSSKEEGNGPRRKPVSPRYRPHRVTQSAPWPGPHDPKLNNLLWWARRWTEWFNIAHSEYTQGAGSQLFFLFKTHYRLLPLKGSLRYPFSSSKESWAP